MADDERPPWEDSIPAADGQREELERMLGLPTSTCDQCAAYQTMLKLLMDENTEMHAKIMEAELGRKLAEEMLPPHIQRFLVNQAEIAERLRKAKELMEEEKALGQIQGLTKPVSTGRTTGAAPPQVNVITQPNAPVGKLIDWRGVAVAVPNTITDPDNSWMIPFGKYRGRMLIEIPTDYLQWCVRQDWLRPEPRIHMNNVVKERLSRKTP